MSNKNLLELLVQSDLLELSDNFGGELIYQRSEDAGVIVLELDEEGDVVGQYRLNISLEPLDEQ